MRCDGAARITGGALGAGLMLLAGGALAGEAQERLFATGALGNVATGAALVYDFERLGAFPADRLAPVEGGAARLGLRDGAKGREAVVTLDDNSRAMDFDPFPAGAGNPIFLVFMEQNVTAMATLTGGSPFYIRNRMREALAEQDRVAPVEVVFGGATLPGRRLSFAPFAEDENRARMGVFADLEISFVMSDAVPGEFASLRAETGPAPDGTPAFLLSFDLDHLEEEK